MCQVKSHLTWHSSAPFICSNFRQSFQLSIQMSEVTSSINLCCKMDDPVLEGCGGFNSRPDMFVTSFGLVAPSSGTESSTTSLSPPEGSASSIPSLSPNSFSKAEPVKRLILPSYQRRSATRCPSPKPWDSSTSGSTASASCRAPRRTG